MTPTEQGEFFLFRVFTPKGRFHLWVETDTWEDAEELARAMFEESFGIKVNELRRAKYETGESEETNSLVRARPDDMATDEPWRGMRLYAAKKLWDAAGQLVNFEAEKIRMQAAWAAERQEEEHGR